MKVEKELVRVWTARNDARAYIILGDPAAHLKLPGNLLTPQGGTR